MTFTPTEEQLALISAAAESDANLAAIARAGAAKTSTLVLMAEAMPKKTILCLAFNKKIATEMAERLPANCESKTLHGLGYKAWYGFTRKRSNVDKGKVYRLTKQEIEAHDDPEDKQELWESFSDLMDVVSKGKNAGWLPDTYRGHWKPLVGNDIFFASLPTELTTLQQQVVENVSIRSFKEALDGNLDFDDMVFCPAICAVEWPEPDVTLVDEAQDLSALNHHILKKIVKKRRIIAVGDPLQAIYGFRGASVNSMAEMIDMFHMETYYLTISFRCSKAVTKNARWLASDMKWPEWAAEGLVATLPSWEPGNVGLGDAIVCRNNAPLFALAFAMIEADMLPEIAGKDIGAPLRKIMKKLGKPKELRAAAEHSLEEWKERELKKARAGAKGGIMDRYECVKLFLERTETLGDAIAYLDALMAKKGRVYLMTGHKAKGLEFDRVFFLDQFLCQIKYEQDANIKYVIETRAKKELFYVTSDSFSHA